jgi:RNA polymerase sigma-70 factor (ECF subfamily)
MSFDDIYSQNYQTVYVLARKILKDEEASKDIAQDVFVKLHAKITSGEEIFNIEGWLGRVTYNHSLNYLRNSKRELNTNNYPIDFTENGAEEKIIEEEDASAIRKAVFHMKTKEQVLINLYCAGLSYRQISETTGIPNTSVGKTLARTLEKLRRIYHEETRRMFK